MSRDNNSAVIVVDHAALEPCPVNEWIDLISDLGQLNDEHKGYLSDIAYEMCGRHGYVSKDDAIRIFLFYRTRHNPRIDITY